MDQDDIKWKSVETHSREIQYYSNKITGQQKWTNKNCYCSKPKNSLQPTLPCCYKKPSMNLNSTKKGWTEHSYARRQIRSSLTKKLYCLSDIVNGVQKSFRAREHRKHERRKSKITLDLKKNLTATEDPKNDVRVTKGSRENDKTTKKSKDDVIFIIDLQNVNDKKDLKNDMKTANDENNFPKDLENDVNATLDLKSDSSFTSKVTKNGITAKNDSVGDTNVSKDPLSLAKEPKDYVVDMKDAKNDVTAVDDFNNDVTVVKDPINVVVATAIRTNDVSEAQDSNNAISNDASKMNEKIITHKRAWKRKTYVDDNINGYKGRLRVRRNKLQKAIRRKYRRRKPLKNAAFSSESVQPNSTNTPNNPTKKKKLEVDNKVLQTDCDLIEQSIIEIVRYTSGYSAKVNQPGSDLGSERLRSEGAESGLSNASTGGNENPSTSFSSTSPDLRTTLEKNLNKTSEVRFIDEKFVRMNIPFENLAEVDQKDSVKSKRAGSVEKKHPVSRRKRQKVLHAVVTSEISSHRPVVAQMRSPASGRCATVSSVYLSSASLTNVFGAGTEATQTKSHVSNTEKIGTPNYRNQVDENGSLKAWSSPNLTSSIYSSFPSGKCNFLPKNRTQKSLNEIVNCMNSPNKVEVPLTSTVSMVHWSAVISKESKKVTKPSLDTQENDLSSNGTPLNTEQIDGLNCANDVGADCPESKSSVFGHIKDAFSIASMPQTSSIETVSQGGSQLSSGRTHNSNTPASRGEAVRKTRNIRETVTNTIKPELLFPTPEQGKNVTEVPASYVDLSWRIVTSNDGHLSSLSNFFKLVPITIARGPSSTLDTQEPTSFLGVPIHGGPAVIAKILNTSCAQNCNEIFQVTRRPKIETAGAYVKKSTLSFVWDKDAVLVNSESLKAGDLSGKDVKPRPPIWIDMCNRVSIVLPKPLRLPEAGNVIYLGDFNVKLHNCVEFVVTHSVEVTKSPRPSLTVPSGTPVNSNSTVSQAIRCRSPGKAKKDVQSSKKFAVGRKTSKGESKTFQKCVFCGTDLKCQKDVKMHRKLHATFAGTKCSECRRRFRNGGRLSVHLVTHKCNWLHVCAVCKKSYRTPKFLTPVDLAKDYYKMCLPCRRKELKCKKCTERSLTFEDLEVHLKDKHGLYCPICKCSFFFKRDLLKHMNILHGILGVPPSSSTVS